MKKSKWRIILPLLCVLFLNTSCAQNLKKCEVVFWTRAALHSTMFFQINENGEVTSMICDADAIHYNINTIYYKSTPYALSKEEKGKICEYLGEIKQIQFTDDRYKGIKGGPVVKVSYLGKEYITDYTMDESIFEDFTYQEGHQSINDFVNYLLDITHFDAEYKGYIDSLSD